MVTASARAGRLFDHVLFHTVALALGEIKFERTNICFQGCWNRTVCFFAASLAQLPRMMVGALWDMPIALKRGKVVQVMNSSSSNVESVSTIIVRICACSCFVIQK